MALFTLSVLLLWGCGGNGFEPSGRSLEEIQQKTGFDTTKTLLENIAFDYCDCVSHIDFEKLDEVAALMEKVENPETEIDLSEEQAVAMNVWEFCLMVGPNNDFIAMNKGLEGIDSLMMIASELCPNLKLKMEEFTNGVMELEDNF